MGESQWLGLHVVLEERVCTHMFPKNKGVWVSFSQTGSSFTTSETLPTLIIFNSFFSFPTELIVYTCVLPDYTHVMNLLRRQIHPHCQ